MARRISQLVQEVVHAQDSSARVSQVVVEVLHSNATVPTARVSQSALLIIEANPFLTPSVITPNISGLITRLSHRFATLWQLVRIDGTEFLFTDHNENIVFNTKTFTPLSSLQATARQQATGLRNYNFDIKGVLDSAAITEADLLAGKFREALVSEFLVDWQYPWAGAVISSKHFIENMSFNGEVWEAQLSGISSLISRPVGTVYGRTCRHVLGDDGCKIDLGLFRKAGNSVIAVSESKTKFTVNVFQPIASDVDDWYNFGEITWDTGDNSGISTEIKLWVGTPTFEISLAIPAPFPINIGDTFSATPGCGKTLQICDDKFDNVVNHGGFPNIPGQDKMLKTPRKPQDGVLGIISNLLGV